MDGRATITPLDPVKAGHYGSWKLIYTIGASGIAINGGITVGTDSDTDWAPPQFCNPIAPNYATVTTTGKTRLSVLLEGGQSWQLRIKILDSPLLQEDSIIIVFGDRSSGGIGSRAQTFSEARRYFRVKVDTSGSGVFAEVLDPPHLQIVGEQIWRLSTIVPSTVTVGRPFSMVVRALDTYGNPSPEYDGKIALFSEPEGLYLPEDYIFNAKECGVHRFDSVQASKEGLYRIMVRDEARRLVAKSNPLLATERPEQYTLCWGDMHGQVKLADKIPEYFRFARDVSALDFAGHQRNDRETTNSDWEKTKQAVREFHSSGFVVLPGYEWSGQTPVGGDHNIYFLDEEQPLRRSGHDLIEDKSDTTTDLTHINDVYQAFVGRKTIIIPHVGGRPANLAFHNADLEPVIEVHSAHGTFEWFLKEAVERGHKVGFVAGSDDYKLRLGGAYPGFDDRRFTRGGLTAVFASELTREGIFEALKRRRCYATTGDRILLKLLADGHPMGDEYTIERNPEIQVHVIGTDALERVELYRGIEKVYSAPELSSLTPSNRFKVTWRGASRRMPYSGILWRGGLKVEKGTLNSLRYLPLDRPDEQFFDVSEAGFSWETYTCGDQDGASFEVIGEESELAISCSCIPTEGATVGGRTRQCAPLNQNDELFLRFRVAQLGLHPIETHIGPVDRAISVQRLPEETGFTEISFKQVDNNPRLGTNAYWVRVVQSDGEMAWSSPIFANRVR